MAKHTYHFKHDFNAHNDEKIIDLRMDHGMEGYGVYWYLIEVLASADEYKLEANYKRIAFSCGSNEALVKDVIEKYNLFTIDMGLFYSQSLIERMSRLDEIKRKRAEAGAKGGKAKAIPKQKEAIGKQTQAEESKGEERRVNKSKEVKRGAKAFSPPTLEDLKNYCIKKEIIHEFDYQLYHLQKEANGWTLGGGRKMKSWEADVMVWHRKGYAKKSADVVDENGEIMPF